MSNPENKAIAFITKRIEEGQCILIVGPDISVSETEKSINELLNEYLEKNFDQLKYYSDDEFFSFANNSEKEFALADIKRFYKQLEPNDLHCKIAEIPFRLIISLSPDNLLNKAFDNQNLNYAYGHYNKEQNSIEPKKIDKKIPLIYNLFGDINFEESVVFTYDDLFEFLISIFGKFELPINIQTELASSRLVLLLGIKFEKWYFKLILRILKLHKSSFNRASEKTRNLLPIVKNFYSEEFKIQFLECDEVEIINSIYTQCLDKNLLRSQNPILSVENQGVFISYRWEANSEKIVNRIYETLTDKGFDIKVDKIILGFKGNVKEFMQDLGKGKYVIVIISDKYLKSENCMYEMLELHKHKNFYNRIFPIVLSDAKIYDESDRIDYINYWDDKIEELNTKYKTVKNPSGTGQTIEKINQYRDIRAIIDEITDMLRNMNTLSPDIHDNSNFSELLRLLDRQIKNDG